MKTLKVAVLTTTMMLGCAAKPDASSICKQIEAAGIGTSCTQVKPEIINARAKTKVDFDLVRVPGKKGAVLDFASADDYSATVNAYAAAAMLAGPHRYGNPSTHIFVQLNTGASLEDGGAVSAIVSGQAAPIANSVAKVSPLAAPAVSAATEAPPEKPKPIVLLATDFYDEYQKNEVAADEKYKGKPLRVVGRLLSIDKDALGQMVIKMEAGATPLASIRAQMREGEKAKVVGLQKKQALSIECEGGDMVLKTPSLRDCIVLTNATKP
jgi:hypothetical protein